MAGRQPVSRLEWHDWREFTGSNEWVEIEEDHVWSRAYLPYDDEPPRASGEPPTHRAFGIVHYASRSPRLLRALMGLPIGTEKNHT